ncbi:putative bifunctional diguanylate cyclase/phosphodiesterase [Methylobacterium sp. J-070]|uniref:putative bifunctional diguanylate cyclase/phosphodiesterase n=1 Tax=Methylobacterium sp. J-070 TaxID=2836650 RepID=UPI001FB97C6F|nr:EAL domain-containing protein [Methylobacterium sp. J-070]MCJ2054022.1 EAL domain-containing protein [Methylobacterium sp. J-070]
MNGLQRDVRASELSVRDLTRLIRRDQLEAVRRSVFIAIPVNILLGLTGTLVAFYAGLGRAGATWFAISLSINLARAGLCKAPLGGLLLTIDTSPEQAVAHEREIERQLRLASFAAFASGLVWAFVPTLCEGLTSASTTFYLVVTCGITAGSVTHGIAFARVPLCFITLPLLSTAACLVYAGGLENDCLAGTVLLYLLALARSAIESEKVFRRASRSKHEASAAARAAAAAHAGEAALAEEMRRRATHDDLTGLLNRAGFAHAAEAQPCDPGETRCLLLLDLDGFKTVNDIYGHQMGDRVLIEVGRRLRDSLPPDATAARLGGDEFALLYDPQQSGLEPSVVAERLIEAVAVPFGTVEIGRLGVSIGIQSAHTTSITQMLSCADEALYSAKSAGRNSYRMFDANLRAQRDMRRDSGRDLSKALVEEVLTVWFQPIFNQDGSTIAGLEALVRWQHPQHGWIPPGDIIAAAANAGLTESLLRFILERVCGLMSLLQELGLSQVRVAMNVSPREMAQLSVDAIVLRRLEELALPPSGLEIEITEETALGIDVIQDKLLRLADAGVRMALDDFGVGYASLASLRQLHAGRIKIDRSLVTGLSQSRDKNVMVQAVLNLGASLGLEVVAEGVETSDDLSALQSLECPFVQGYHLGRPMPLSDLIPMLSASRAAA